MHTRNFSGVCLDKNSSDSVVLHKVSYETDESGEWVRKHAEVYATDPMQAIDIMKDVLNWSHNFS